MTKQLIVTREARADLAEAIAWLRHHAPEQVERFEAALEKIYGLILEYPEMYPVVYRRFRRALLRKFPYSVFYTIEKTCILIAGVVHQARDESTWKRRA